MIVKSLGIALVQLLEDPTGGPGSRLLRLLPESGGGEIQINVTVNELRRLRNALPEE